jgi:Rps23 Pro-64 3,4-dihydroxylase Tpa1-like proline 4-hydroxylase
MLNSVQLHSAHDGVLLEEFQHADPFPHIVIDGLFEHQQLSAISEEFSQIAPEDWVRYRSVNEVKAGTRQGAQFGPATQAYFDVIHRDRFLRFLSAVTGIQNLIPDPSLFGGGLHEIWPGGKFSVHTDFTRHPKTGLTNRLVMITYLNEGWEDSFGGALQLWNARQNACVVKVSPLLGRTIIFEQVADSLHGHPDPVCTSDGRTRRSITAYFYTAPSRQAEFNTSWSSTQFLKNGKLQFSRSDRVKQLVHSLTPPVLFEGLKQVRHRLAPQR